MRNTGDERSEDEYSCSGRDNSPRSYCMPNAEQENMCCRPLFSAFFPKRKRWNIHLDERVTCFYCIKYNNGDHYNPRDGIFTAPWHGVYAVSLNFYVHSGGKVQINVLRKGSGPVHSITHTSQPTRFSKACDVYLVELLPGDELFISSAIESRNIVFDESSHFSCFLVFQI
ncbi:hypothetical protein Btru_059224 [Bulinus truncatus]|nr:hypothetical protein Btru_059224 [Bulinus truncatus]